MDIVDPTNDIRQQVIAFVSGFCRCRAEDLQDSTTLVGDLGVDGEDGTEFIRHFSIEFGVDVSSFDLSRHFGPEGISVWAPVYWFLHRTGLSSRDEMVPISIDDLVQSVVNGRL